MFAMAKVLLAVTVEIFGDYEIMAEARSDIG
jgi:hypothetical protein